MSQETAITNISCFDLNLSSVTSNINKTIRIKPIGLDQHEVEKFSACLDLAEFGLKASWEVVKTEQCDFYLLKESPLSNNYKDLSPGHCFFYRSDAERIDIQDNAILIDVGNVPSIQSLIRVLNRNEHKAGIALTATEPKPIEEVSTKAENNADKALITPEPKPVPSEVVVQLEQKPSVQAAAAKQKPIEKVSATLENSPNQPGSLERATGLPEESYRSQQEPLTAVDPAEQQLSTAIITKTTINNDLLENSTWRNTAAFDPKHHFIWELINPPCDPILFEPTVETNVNVLYVSMNKKVYYSLSRVDHLIGYFTKSSNWRTIPLTESVMKKVVGQDNLYIKPLSYLIWYCAFVQSQGLLLLGHTANEPIILKKKPYPHFFANDVNFAKITNFMLNKTTTLEKAANATGVPFETIINFYNASYIIGYIQRPSDSKKPSCYFSPTDIQGFIEASQKYEKNLKSESKSLMGKLFKRLTSE